MGEKFSSVFNDVKNGACSVEQLNTTTTGHYYAIRIKPP